MQDFFSIISNFGFPVAVASYLLFRFEKKLEALEKTNDELVLEIKASRAKTSSEIKKLREKIIELEAIIKTLKAK